MKTLTFLIFLLCFSCTQAQKKRILFFGDSITEMAVKPNGFISVINEKLGKKNNNNYTFIGAGINSNKVYDLYLRLEEDVLKKKPDVVVIWIGVNDVWHKTILGTGTDADKFEKFYTAIINKLK